MAYKDDKKRLRPTEIVDRFGVDYYEIQIDDLEARIGNIRFGKGDQANGVMYVSADRLKDSRDRERRISQLQKRIEDYKRTIREIREAISLVNQGMSVLRKAEETHALIGGLSDDLRYCFLKYTERDKNGDRRRIPSEMYDAIFVNKMFQDAKSKYRRLWSKEFNKANRETRKIKKDIYRKLKKVQNKYMVDDYDYEYGYRSRYSHSSRDLYSYDTLNSSLTDNGYTLKGFPDRLASDLGKDYNSWDTQTLAPLGVEVDKVKRAYEISDGAERLFDEFDPILKSMEYLSKEYAISSKYKTFNILKYDMEQVSKLSREVECLDLIIDAYDNTAIKDTELFKTLIEIYRKQNKKLNVESRKIKEMYQRSGLQEVIEMEKKLRELHQKAGSLRYQVSISEEKLGYADPETRKLNDMYFGARSEMLSIVLKYPELNKPEYGIDLTKYDKKGRYIGNEPEEKIVRDTPSVKPPKVEKEEPFIPTRVVTEDELKRDLGQEEDKTKGNEETLEVPDYLTGIRTAYYSRYMVEKVKGSDLGKLLFSEYLTKVAPDQEELIEVERTREKKAANVFKLYVQYLASLEDKSKAMKFSEFAEYRHGLDKDSLPFEYTDEEVQKRLKK